MRILLIKPKHIGDTLLLTPTIVAIKRDHPEAEIWVVVRRGCEGILAGCPEIHRILTVAAVDKSERRPTDFLRELGIFFNLLSVKFDYVFELGDGHRGRLLARLARADRRFSVKPATPLDSREFRRFDGVSQFDWELCHRVEKDFYSVADFFPLAPPIPPLRFVRDRTEPWPEGATLKDFCVVQVGTRQAFNRWPAENWRELCRALLKRFENVVVSCGPVEKERELTAALRGELGAKLIDTEGNLSWAQLAGLLYRARLYVGLNTAAMHLAAACGCPVVALIGSPYEENWRPWQSAHRLVADSETSPTGDGKADLQRARQRSMEAISPAQAIAACDEMIREGRASGGPIGSG